MLEEPVQKRRVKEVVNAIGVDYKGATLKVVHDERLIGTGFCGYTYPDGKRVEFYPDAFKDTETLVKTVAHEAKHVAQALLLGETWDSIELGRREAEARSVEAAAWESYQKGR